jgi:hypothetical protein
LPVGKEAVSHKGASALDHWIAVAATEIFDDGMRDQLIAPARGYYDFKPKLVAGVRKLHRCGGRGGKQHVVADYGDRKRMRSRQTYVGRAGVK